MVKAEGKMLNNARMRHHGLAFPARKIKVLRIPRLMIEPG